jgi:hypothetical protein
MLFEIIYSDPLFPPFLRVSKVLPAEKGDPHF